MHTLEHLHSRALKATGAAADRCTAAGSDRLANLAEEAHELAQRAFRAGNAGLLASAIATARSIGRRVRRVTRLRGVVS